MRNIFCTRNQLIAAIISGASIAALGIGWSLYHLYILGRCDEIDQVIERAINEDTAHLFHQGERVPYFVKLMIEKED